MKKTIVVLAAFGLLFLASPSAATDTDSDGVADGDDNCLNEPNSDQVDSNFDGFGNLCDPDIWNDGVVEDVDYEIFRKAWGSTSSYPNWNPDADFDGDGAVGASDYGILGNFWGDPPGPSGLACAGTIPCAASTPDEDSDGVGDLADNCVEVPNASQDDSNMDGIGTACDPDYNNDGIVDDVDYAIFANAWGSTSSSPNWNPDCDHDGDGAIGAGDYIVLSILFDDPPGPTGEGASFERATASSERCDTIGCP